MGWGNMRTKTERGPGERAVLAAAGSAQLPAAFFLWSLHIDDPYGRGYGGAFGLACLLLFSPVYVPVLGLLHACVHTVPGLALARLALRRFPWPRWARDLLGAVLLAAGWAAVPAVLWGWSFPDTALALAAFGVLPVLALAYVRRYAGGSVQAWGVWWRAGLASVLLFALAVVGGFGAMFTGLIKEYDPPRLSAAQVAGVRHGDDGAELRLLPDGQAVLTQMPAQPDSYTDADPLVCDGTGTWSLDRAGEDERWDDVLVRLDEGSGTGSGCGNETAWTVGGTERAPELFMFVGDPDLGELRILERAAG